MEVNVLFGSFRFTRIPETTEKNVILRCFYIDCFPQNLFALHMQNYCKSCTIGVLAFMFPNQKATIDKSRKEFRKQ